MSGKPRPLEPRFWANVQKGDGCWKWTGATRHAYGVICKTGRRQSYAHRVAWEIQRGPIPVGLCVLHRCDNPLCVRADHLFIGTQLENIADRSSKGRTAVLSREHYQRAGYIGGKRRWGRDPGGIRIIEV